MKRIAFLIFLISLSIAQFSFAQMPPRISGYVFDKETNKSLPGAAVVVKTLSDSILASAITNEDGLFEIRKPIRGEIKVMVSFIGYETSSQNYTLIPRQPLVIEKIMLVTQSQDLKEVIVVDNANAVKVNSDTTEFNASAYKTQTNAVAEDLIKKMPGMEVDENGKVKSQGQDVRRVLVDGKPFFGDDPSLALRNLPAEVIDKVQMVDQMNEQAQFTGFDDNERIKTMNIVTKKNSRKGLFGKIGAGYGTDDRYSGGGNFNYFNGDRRLSVVATANNTNEMNFSSQDVISSAGAPTMMGRRPMGDGGSFGTTSGINQLTSLGLNFSDVWGPKVKISASYFLNHTLNDNEQLSNSEYFLSSTTSQYTTQNSISDSKNLNHRFNMRLEWSLDTMNYLMIRPSFSFQDNNRNSLSDANTRLADGSQINTSNLDYKTISQAFSFANELQFNHKFDKKGRTFSINSNYSLNPQESNVKSISQNVFYNTLANVTDLTNRNTLSTTKGYSISSNFAYTEPVWNNGMVQASYYVRYNKNSADKQTFNYSPISQLYDNQDILLSNTFDNGYTTQRYGFSIMQKISNAMVSVGVNYQTADLKNTQVYPQDFKMNKNFENTLPYASLSWKSGKKSSLNINYTTQTRQPDISQLQNVYNTSNTMKISSGNPELKPEYSHNLFSRFSFVQPETNRTIMFILGGSYLTNRIANSSIIASKDTLLSTAVLLGRGAQYSKPINITDPYWNLRSFITLGAPLFNKKLNFNLNSGISFTSDPGLINGGKNTSNTYSYNEGIVLSSNISPKIDFTLSGNLSYNKVENTIHSELNSNYSSEKYAFRVNMTLFKRITASSTTTYLINKGMGIGYNLEYLLWNASLGVQFLKDKNAEFKVSVFDILEENSSVSRNVTQSYVEDVRNMALKQYFMFSLIYNIRKFAGGGKGNPDMNPNFNNKRREEMHMH